MNTEKLIEQLNAEKKEARLAALRKLAALTKAGKLPEPQKTNFVNNHIHTTYSFSPYSPTKAVYMAWQNGLATAGIMDHDSLSGAKEFIEAAEIVGLPVTVGMECRASMIHSELIARRINNPDQKSVAYVALHGIPHQNIDLLNNFFEYYRIKRGERNRKMCERITELVAPYGLSLDYEKDVLPLSMAKEGGSVTERHILFGLTKKITALYKTPDAVLRFLTEDMGIAVSEKVRKQITDTNPAYYEYDILGALKSNLV
ncbi:MAG: PHP domain-containing protein, partial [Ruminococcus sp.]|nr:PHP domain-containing protein [Candidatus Apopatosoma intestinale]